MTGRKMIAIGITFVIALSLLAAGLIPTGVDLGGIQRSGPLVHALGFGLLTLPLAAVWPSKAWLCVLGATAYGGLIEALQVFTDRATEAGDVAANFVGSALGALAGWCIASLVRRSKPRAARAEAGRNGSDR